MSDRTWPPRGDEDYLQQACTIVDASLLERLRNVRLMVFDVDGVMTPGNIVYGPDGEMMKEFDTRDGFGLMMARAAGLKRAILTGRDSPIAERRARDLKFDAIKMARFDKREALREILAELDVDPAAALYMGDDLIDIPAMDLAGLAVTVPAACEDVRARCRYVTAAAGGRGAVREIVELVLKSRGLFGRALETMVAVDPKP